MKTRSIFLKSMPLCMLFVFFTSGFAQSKIQENFEKIKSDPNALYAFFKEMPKGGELHYHLAGGAYPEAMLALANKTDYCINLETSTLSPTSTPCAGLLSRQLYAQPQRYEDVLRAWSMKDFIPGTESGLDHFFATFDKFHAIIVDSSPSLLADVMKRAANQNELYLEIMILPDDANAISFAPISRAAMGYAAKQKTLLANKHFQDNIRHSISEGKNLLQAARDELSCDTLADQKVCALQVKFQYYVLREQAIDAVFAQALSAFATVAQSEDFVGVNLVQAENGLRARQDYQEQMRVFKFLHTAYPKVSIALHAGELAPQSVAPADLRFHVHDAIFTGQAKRIGHGVSVAYEDKANQLLDHMAKHGIPVEINLSSNRQILGIAGKNHPLHYYLAHHVPVVLSSDDEGVLRTDLSREYVEAVIHQGLNYAELKNINRNTLSYSFLSGENLWADPKQYRLVPACRALDSSSCQHFIQHSPKAKLQWLLEKKLIAFERSQ
jgi:adenosine deaminase